MRFAGRCCPQRWLVVVALLLAFTGLVASPALAAPRITCALPVLQGGPGADCVARHQILVGQPSGFSGAPTVTAELIALDLEGNVITTLPVSPGDQAHLASRISPADFKAQSKSARNEWRHEMFAPVPLLKVTAFDPVTQERAEAYCSNIPYLDVLQPNGAVVSAMESDAIRVHAAIPRVDAGQVQIYVDGADVFPLIDKSPAECTAASPCCTTASGGCTVDLHGDLVTIRDVVVDSAPELHIGSSNTASLTVSGLQCGGHAVVVTGAHAPSFRMPGSAQCHVDDLTDRGVASIFAMTVTAPAPGETGVAVPTPVEGEVCGGVEIASVDINGQAVSTAGQVVIPGDGFWTTDTVKLDFSTQLGQTNLAQDVNFGDAPLGTFDAGTNRVLASARDVLGNRTYDNVLFATGMTLNPGISPLAMQSLEMQTLQGLGDFIQQQIQESLLSVQSVVEVDNAFVVGIKPSAIQKFFDEKCPQVGQTFRTEVRNRILGKGVDPIDIQPVCSCNVNNLTPSLSVTIDPNDVSCVSQFVNGKIQVAVDLPDIEVVARYGPRQCQTDLCDPITGICVCATRTVVDATARANVTGISASFEITEGQLMPGSMTTPPVAFIEGTTATSLQGNLSGNQAVDIQCIIGDICEVALTVFTLGLVDFTPEINVSSVQDFRQEIGAAEPDPIALNEIKVDEQVVLNFDQQISGEVTSVSITPQGLIAALKGSFATTVIDPAVAETPGALLVPTPVPAFPIPNVDDAFMALSNNTLNMLLASMTMAGRLQTTCQPTDPPTTVADLLPADCESLVGETEAATQLLQATCHAVKGDDCEALAGSGPLATAVKQGICHGVQGNNCATIPVSATTLLANTERNTCDATPPLNIHGSQNVLLCTKQDIPPRVLLLGGGGNSPVQSALRLNDLSVGLVIDRNNDGFDHADIADTPPCFGTDAAATGDCRLYALCLDLNFNFDMEFATCEDGKPGIGTAFRDVQVLNRQAGVVCDGSGAAGSDSEMLSAAANDNSVVPQLGSRAQEFMPPVCAKGLDLADIVSCGDPKLIVLETDGAPDFKEYLGVTCSVNP
jgi:hypothetical protein